MNFKEWNELVQYVSNTFGVNYGVGDDEQRLATTEEELYDSWFICPTCQETLCYEDVDEMHCPCCEAYFYDEEIHKDTELVGEDLRRWVDSVLRHTKH